MAKYSLTKNGATHTFTLSQNDETVDAIEVTKNPGFETCRFTKNLGGTPVRIVTGNSPLLPGVSVDNLIIDSGGFAFLINAAPDNDVILIS